MSKFRPNLILLCLLSNVAAAGTLEHTLTIEPGKLHLVSVGAETAIRVPGYPSSAPPGEIALPARVIRLLLPPGAALESLVIEVLDEATPVELPIAGRRLERGPTIRVLCPALCSGGSGTVGGGVRLPLSGQTVTLRSGGHLGEIAIAEFVHRPVELDRAREVLVLHPRQQVRLLFDEHQDWGIRGAARPSRFVTALATRLSDNPTALGRRFLRPLDPPNRPGLALITTAALVSQSQALQEYVAALEQRGFAVKLVTESDFGQVAGQPPNERPQQIRAWLQQNEQVLGLEVAVLVGNPDPFQGDLPMLKTYPYPPGSWEYSNETPTDAFYADLTGNWDKDGDGIYGEFEDDGGPGGVDFLPELQVGRIPSYGDIAVLDKLLRRAISYPQDHGKTLWRRRILFPGAMLFFQNQDVPGTPQMEGGDVAEYMKAEFETRGFDVTTMYETKGVQPTRYPYDLPLTEDELIREWNSGYGLIYWFGHGSEDGAYRTIWRNDSNQNHLPEPWEIGSEAFMQSISFDRLPYQTPAFVFHGSCSNGTPETAANIGYTMIKSGAIATFSSSRVALGWEIGLAWEPNPDNADIFTLGYYAVSRLRDLETAGAAIGEARALLTDEVMGPWAWHTKFATTLYGDPTLSLRNCDTDAECSDNQPCNGTETCSGGICQAGNPVDCSGLDRLCVQGRCDPATGTCQPAMLDGKACDDELFCTVGDRCQQDQCLGVPRVCTPLDSECILGVCDEEQRACRSERAAEGQDCSLGDATGECRFGLCQPKPASGCGCESGGAPPWLSSLLALLCLLAFRRRSRMKTWFLSVT